MIPLFWRVLNLITILMKVNLERSWLLFSDTSTSLEEISIEYDNKVTTYDDYYDDMYAIKSNKSSMLVHHDNSAVCDSYIVEFIHDATENYYERGTCAFTYCNNVKFPLYVLKILKLCLFCLPMLVDSCSHKLFAHKIPMHRKCVRLKCACHLFHDALFMFQFLSFMRESLKSACQA